MLDFANYLAQVQRNRRSSALTPLLWLNSLVTVPALFMSLRTEDTLRVALFSLASLIVVCTIIAYGYLLRKDPRLVQSETFQLEARKLDIIASKGGPVLEALAVEVTEEPKVLEPAKAKPLAAGSSDE